MRPHTRPLTLMLLFAAALIGLLAPSLLGGQATAQTPAGASPTTRSAPAPKPARPAPARAAKPASAPATRAARTAPAAPATAPATSPAATTTAAADPATTAPADPESLPIPEGSASPVSVGGGMGASFMRLLFGLAIVVALIFGVWQLLKRVQRGRYPAIAHSDGDLVGVLATTPLGPNRALHIVRIGDTVVLVGATDHAIQTVTTLDPTTAAAIIAAREGSDRPAGPGAGPGGGPPPSLLDRIRQYTVRG